SAPNRTITFDRAFAPFGELYDTAAGGTSNPSFTGDTQDTVSGEYDTPNRELHPTEGRWISPDPAGISAVDVMNPQTWNRYAYVVNTPLTAVDPSGMEIDRGQRPCSEIGPCAWGATPLDEFPDFSDNPTPPVFSIFSGENSVNIPLGTGDPFADLWQA